jgi:hypothetical protein
VLAGLRRVFVERSACGMFGANELRRERKIELEEAFMAEIEMVNVPAQTVRAQCEAILRAWGMSDRKSNAAYLLEG